MKFIPINNMLTMIQIMAWCQTGDKPLSETRSVNFKDASVRQSAKIAYKYL